MARGTRQCSCVCRRDRAPNAPAEVHSLSEAEGKAALAHYGVAVPAVSSWPRPQAAGCAEALGFPVVIKAVGAHLEHKTEVGGVALNIRTASRGRRGRSA